MTETMTVAETILEQLGGNRFVVMTGAKHFVGSQDSLSFSLPGKSGFVKQGINKVNITLKSDDTYLVQFYRIRGGNFKLISQFENIYCDQLQELFTKQTGLATHL